LTPTALAERTAVTPATMTGLIDTLEKDGLVQRLSDPQDRRKVIVSLAPRAHDLLAQILPGHFRLLAAILRPLSLSDRKRLVSLLQVVAAHATSLALDRETTGAEASPA
jgi:DNA-binding MarR family transcriptional regulator